MRYCVVLNWLNNELTLTHINELHNVIFLLNNYPLY